MRYGDCIGFWEYAACTLLYLLKGLGWLLIGAGILGIAGVVILVVIVVAVVIFNLVVTGSMVYGVVWVLSGSVGVGLLE